MRESDARIHKVFNLLTKHYLYNIPNTKQVKQNMCKSMLITNDFILNSK